MNFQKLACLASIAVMCGCASGWDTPYQEATLFSRGGVSHKISDDGIYAVKARGNGFTTNQTSIDHMYLKAAELTIENGGSCFQVLNHKESVGYASTGSLLISYPINRLEFLMVESSDTCEYHNANEIYNRLAPEYIKSNGE